MALYAFEGFDNYYMASHSNVGPSYNSYDLTLNTGKMQWTEWMSYLSPQTGRQGIGKSVNILSAYLTLGTSFGEAYIGFALTAPNAANTYRINIREAIQGVTHCYIIFNPTNSIIQVYNGNGTYIGSTVLNALNFYSWNFVELHIKIGSGTSGIFEIQVNGSTVFSNTACNTQDGTNADFNQLQWATTYGTDGAWLTDDLRINDTTTGAGSYPCNSWMGDLRCVTLYPTANHSVAWTPLSGSNWSEVNEQGTTALGGSYNYTTTAGAVDLFQMQALPNVINYIAGVQVKGAYQQQDSSSHQLENALSIAGTTYTGTSWTLTNTYQYLTDLWAVNPNTSNSWTYSDIINMFVGYENVS
jgi:hypothetical protein